MGNRAVITTEDKRLGVYVHWNGGQQSIEAFLAYCKLKGYRAPEQDNYGFARLCQVIGNFFGGTTSIGIDTLDKLDCNNGDNGMYIIKNWEIIDREYPSGYTKSNESITEMLIAINNSQSESDKIDSRYFDGIEKSIEELKVGDQVFVQHGYDSTYTLKTIVGIGEDERRNGRDVKGIPYVDLYINNGNYKENSNNYLHDKKYVVIE